MIKVEQETKVVQMGASRGPSERLPYTVELCTDQGEAERIIGRAASLGLARAIFAAARSEHVGRRLVLRRGADVVEESR